MLKADAVVIGGGGIGLSILYYLIKGGCQNVMLLERGMLATESTGKSAGGFRHQFSTDINIKMSQLTIKIFETFNEEMQQETLFHKKGYTFLIQNEQQLKLYKRNVQLQQSLGVNVDIITLDQLKELVPYIHTDDLIAATFCPDDGFSDPYEIAQGYARQARKMGAKIKENSPVVAIQTENGKVISVSTDKETIETPIVINAAGPWAGEVGKLAGLDLPIKPYRRQIYTSAPFKPFINYNYRLPMVVDPSGVYLRSEGQTILMGKADKNEPPSFNQNLEWSFLEQLVEPAVNRIPIFEELEIQDGWAGLYDTTPDHHAILGTVPELQGFIMAAGFSGHGFMHSAAVGLTLSELILNGKATSVDISPLHLSRFANGGKGIEEVAVI
jgi:sarcosine oxidase subunit beta